MVGDVIYQPLSTLLKVIWPIQLIGGFAKQLKMLPDTLIVDPFKDICCKRNMSEPTIDRELYKFWWLVLRCSGILPSYNTIYIFIRTEKRFCAMKFINQCAMYEVEASWYNAKIEKCSTFVRFSLKVYLFSLTLLNVNISKVNQNWFSEIL